jgi:putative selenium metabolism protein SsnA
MTSGKRIFSVGALYDGAGRFVRDCDVFIDAGVLVRILPRGDESEESNRFRRAHDGAERIRMPDGLVLPGLMNSHHHAYSALARGMPVDGPVEGFPAALERLWWRLDRALDREAVRLSGLVTALASVRRGCTAVVDHHSSPSWIDGSLQALADAFGALSMTAVLCYETSDRNGPAALERSVEENLSFIDRQKGSASARGVFGLHASFTLSRATLERLARIVPEDVPVHVHVAEDRCDVDHARAEGFAGPLDRLAALGVLRRRSLVGHGVHLAEAELGLLETADAFVVHNPQSNFNNGVGYADLDRLPLDRLLLGTDGMSSDMIGAAQFAFLAYRGLGGGGRDPVALARRMLFENPSAYLSATFGRPVGRLEEGRPADLAIFDYGSPTPLGAENLAAHVIYGLAPAPSASWVYARGVPVLEDGAIVAVDEGAILEAARAVAAEVWDRYAELSRDDRLASVLQERKGR